MRVLVHDYSGHPFPVQLSRELARRGHTVRHVYSASFQTPKGRLAPNPDDPPGFSIEGLRLAKTFAKYSFVRRFFQERTYGKTLVRAIDAFGPEIVLSGNAPLDPQDFALRYCRGKGVPFVYWQQDVYALAIDRILRRKLGWLGAPIGRRYLALERRLVRRSDRVVTIADDFVPILLGWGVERARIDVVENWAPLEDLAPHPRDNPFARAHALADKLVFLYSGTLGLKHDPGKLLNLARHFASRPEVRVVVVSEGLGAEWLARERGDLANLVLLAFQPFEQVAETLASADVLVAILEPDAGAFSVPSKVLTYFCAGRPILAAIPPENLAARVILRQDAGRVVAPTDERAFLAAASALASDPGLRAHLGKNGLDYARKTFDIGAIGARFEAILESAARR